MSMLKIQRNAQTKAMKIPDLVSVLIVDDERYDRARLRRICNKLDFEVLISEAATLEDLGSALITDKFDLIFLDFNLTDGDGLQALEAIQMNVANRFSAVIMVTGDDDLDVAIASMTNGCDDFIKKDNVSLESVRRASVNALQKSALNRGLENETNMRANVEKVLNQFTEQCMEELQPMLFNMIRNVRSLHATRLDEKKFSEAVKKIESASERIFDFVADFDDEDRKAKAMVEIGDFFVNPVNAAQELEKKPAKSSLFGRRPC